MSAGRWARAVAKQGPDLLRLPGREGDCRAGREVILQELKRLRVGVRRAVLARREPGVAADQDERP